jgi:hypothetical protein
MVAPLDVFAVKNGEPKWLGCAETLAKALELGLRHREGSHFAFSHQTGHENFYEVAPGLLRELMMVIAFGFPPCTNDPLVRGS